MSAVGERPVFRGHAALKRLGARATWMYLGAGGLALIVHGGPDPLELTGMLILLGVTGFVIVTACRGQRRDALVAAVVINTVMTAVVIKVAADQGWASTTLLAITVGTGGTVGLALGRRPFAGLLAAAAAVFAMTVASAQVGMPLQPLVLLGLPTSTIVASCIALLTGRGFADTELALRGVDDALAMQRVASARWQAGRRADREVHDTVLTTLTVLAHPEFDIDPEPVRELCRRDLAFLSQDSWRVDNSELTATGAPGPAGPGEERPPWAAAGLRVSRLGEVGALATLGRVAGPAVDAAVEECLSNVARHAGVDEAEVVINLQDGNVVVLVVDDGCGFDLDRVPDDRLGLAESVRGRITDLGGSVAVWSRPGAGTTVMLSVPVPAP